MAAHANAKRGARAIVCAAGTLPVGPMGMLLRWLACAVPPRRLPGLGSLALAVLVLSTVILPPVPAAAQPTGPDHIVRLLYQHYIDTTEGLVFSFDYADPVVASNYFTPTLAHLLVADAKGDAPRLDFDPFVDGQDFDIKAVNLETRMLGEDEAEVTARFKNFQEDETRVFTVKKTPRGWRIADVGSDDGTQSLLKYLSLTN